MLARINVIKWLLAFANINVEKRKCSLQARHLVLFMQSWALKKLTNHFNECDVSAHNPANLLFIYIILFIQIKTAAVATNKIFKKTSR